MPRPEKSAAPAPRPAPADLIAECAALDLAARVKFAAAWGCNSPKKASPPVSRADRAAAVVLLASAFAWTFLEEALAAFRRGKAEKARTPLDLYVGVAREVAALAARVGLELPKNWLPLPRSPVDTSERRGAGRTSPCPTQRLPSGPAACPR